MKSSILSRLRLAFILSVSFLVMLCGTFYQLHRSFLHAIDLAYELDSAISQIREVSQNLENNLISLSQLQSAQRKETIQQSFLSQAERIKVGLNQVTTQVESFSEVTKSVSGAQSKIDEINIMAAKILAKSELPSAVDFIPLRQLQLEANEGLNQATILLRKTLDNTYTQIQKQKDRPLYVGVVLTLLLSLVLAALAFFLFQRIQAYIRSMNFATNRVSQGELDVQVLVNRDDELGELSRRFNDMVKALGKARQDLRQSNKNLEDFAFMVSHDLQAPLRHISTFAKMVSEHPTIASHQEIINWNETITLSVKKSNQLIDDLLEFSRLGRGGLKQEDIDTFEMVTTTANEVKSSHQDCEVVIEPLPVIKGYPGILHLVFQNLLQNSIKYRRIEQAPKINISCSEKDTKFVFSVKDNGQGIPEDQRERVFHLFCRLHNQSNISGSGAGLAICKKIVETHGGKIWVERHEGTGTCIRFSIPKVIPLH